MSNNPKYDKARYEAIKSDPVRYRAYLDRKRRERAKKQVDRSYETERKRKWRAANPERTQQLRDANHAVELAIVAGTMIRPDKCSRCGVECKPEGHHHKGYATENWLEVEWLCNMCHHGAHCTP